MLIFRPGGIGRGRVVLAGYLAGSFALILAWWMVIAVGSFRYDLGRSVGGLESNLYLRAERMAYLGGIDLPPSYFDRNAAAGRDTRTLEPMEFVGLAWQRPDLYARTVAADAFNMMANPGVAMLFGRYLGCFDLGEKTHRDLNKWRETREKHGFVGLARLLLETSPVGFLVNAVGITIWIALLGLATYGAVVVLGDAVTPPALRWLLAGLVVYVIVLTSMTAGYTRWDHRSPLEVPLALMVGSATSALRQRYATTDGRLVPLRR
jgi:hypothetical protein